MNNLRFLKKVTTIILIFTLFVGNLGSSFLNAETQEENITPSDTVSEAVTDKSEVADSKKEDKDNVALEESTKEESVQIESSSKNDSISEDESQPQALEEEVKTSRKGTPKAADASVGGKIWLDTNGDGIQNNGEGLVPEQVEWEIYDSNGYGFLMDDEKTATGTYSNDYVPVDYSNQYKFRIWNPDRSKYEYTLSNVQATLDSDYTYGASTDAYADAYVTVRPGFEAEYKNVDLGLKPKGGVVVEENIITGKVTNNSGTALSGINVNINGTNYVTNASGHYTTSSFTVGTAINVSISNPLYNTYSDSYAVVKGTNTKNITLTPKSTYGKVTGVVKDGTGAVLPNIDVDVNGTKYTTNASGVYITSDILTGTVVHITVNNPLYSHYSNNSITVGTTTTTHNIDLVRKTGTVTGVVKNSSGTPLNGVTVNVNGTNYTTNSSGIYTSSAIHTGVNAAITVAGSSAYNAYTNSVTVEEGSNTHNINLVSKTGTVTGVVKNASGTALQGITVVVNGSNYTTNSSGIFTTGNYDVGTNITVSVSNSSYNSYTNSFVLVEGSNTHNINLSAKSAVINGTVKDSLGNPITGVVVDANGTTATTDGTGSYTFNTFGVGTSVTISVSHPGYVDYSTTFTVSDGTNTENIVLVNKVGKVTGKVTSNGTPLAGIVVNVDGVNYTTGATGDYSSSDINIGKNVTVSVSNGAYNNFSESIVIVEGNNTKNIALTAVITPKGTITGTVKNSKGDIVTGISVNVEGVDYPVNVSGVYLTNDLDVGVDATISVTTALYNTFTTTKTVANGTNIANITLVSKPAVLKGVITNSLGNPLSGVTVKADGKTATTDALGQYTITGLEAGTTVDLETVSTLHTDSTQAITLVAGDNFKDMVLNEKVGVVKGTVTDNNGVKLPNITVLVNNVAYTTNVNGEYVSSNINVGTAVTVKIEDSKYENATKPLTIVEGNGNVADFSLVPYQGTIKVLVKNADNIPLDNITVKFGATAVVTNSNGEALSSSYAMDEIVKIEVDNASYKKYTLDFTVVKGESIVTINLEDRVGYIKGTVTDSNGAILSGITVTVGGIDYTSGPDGTYQSDPIKINSNANISVTHNLYNGFTASVNVLEGENIKNISLVNKLGYVTGVVKDSQGSPIKNIDVNVNGTNYKTDNSGQYRSADIAVGSTVEVSVNHSNYQSVSSNVSIIEGPKTHDITLINKTGTVTGIVTNAAGDPMVGIDVSLNGTAYTTDATGRYTSNAINVATRVNVEILSSLYQNHLSNLDVVEGVNTHNITMENRVGKLTGVVKDQDSNPLPGITIFVDGISYTTDASGVYVSDNIVINSNVVVEVNNPSYTAYSDNFTILEGMNTKDVNLIAKTPVAGIITGIVKDSNGDIVPDIIVVVNGTNYTTNASGVYESGNIPVGTDVTVSVNNNKYQPTTSNVVVVAGTNNKDINLVNKVGSVEGLVKDGSGTPLAGIKVMINNEEVTTDSSGKYVKDNVFVGTSITLSVNDTAYEPYTETFNLGEGVNTKNIVLTAKAAKTGTVNGVVTNNENNPVAGVTVVVNGTEYVTDVDGKYVSGSINVGTQVNISVNDSSYNSFTSQLTIVEGVNVLDIKLTPSTIPVGFVTGIVKNASNVPLSGITVNINGTDYTTDNDGKYVSNNMNAGTIADITISAQGYENYNSNILVSVGENVEDITLTAPAATEGYITGLVTDGANEPIIGLTVNVGGTNYVTDNSGVYRTSLLAIGSEPTISINDSRFVAYTGTAKVLIGVNVKDIQLQAVAPKVGHVTGTVVDSDDNPVASLIVNVNGTDYTTDSNGVYTSTDITVGTQVEVKVTDARFENYTKNIDIVEGVNTENIKLVTKTVNQGYVTGIVTNSANEALSGITVNVNGTDYTTDNQGKYVSSNMNVGTVADITINVQGYNTYNSSVLVSLGENLKDVQLTTVAPKVGHVTGTVVDGDDNPVASLVVNVNGTDYTTDSNGVYTSTDITVGTQVEIKVTDSRFETFTKNIDIVEGVNTENIKLVTKTVNQGYVTGIVTNSANEALSGITVNVNGTDYTTDNQGKYVSSNMNVGTVADITINAQGYNTYNSSVLVSLGENLKDVQLTTVAPKVGHVTGTVVDGDDNPVASLVVNVNGTDYTTDSNGVYTSTDITVGTQVEIKVMDSRFETFTKNIDIVEGVNTENIKLVTKTINQGFVTGIVTNSANEPLTGVIVNVNGTDYTTDNDGKYVSNNMNAGTVADIIINAQGYNSYTSSILVSIGENVKDIQLETPAPKVGHVTGTVVDSDDNPVASLVVNVNGTDYTTDNNGVYTSTDITVGTQVEVKVSDPRFENYTKNIDIVEGVNTENIKLITKTINQGYVTGIVTNSANEPLIGITVNVNGTDYTTDNDGKYVSNNMNVGTVADITINAQGYNIYNSSVLVSLGENIKDITLTVPAATEGYITGLVTNAANEPVIGLTVNVGGTDYVTDNSGVYRTNLLAIGSEPTISIDDSRFVAYTGTAQVLQGINVKDIQLETPAPKVGHVTGTVVDGDDNPIASLIVNVNGTDYTTDSNGVYTSTDITVGTQVEVKVTDPRFENYTKNIDIIEGINTENIQLITKAVAQGYVTGIVTNIANEVLSGVKVTVNGVEYTTDANGMYRSSDIAVDTQVTVSIDDVRYHQFTETVTIAEGANAKNIKLAEKVTDTLKVGLIVGTILDENGNPVAGATVKVFNDTYTTDVNGKFTTKEYEYADGVKVYVSMDGYQNGVFTTDIKEASNLFTGKIIKTTAKVDNVSSVSRTVTSSTSSTTIVNTGGYVAIAVLGLLLLIGIVIFIGSSVKKKK